ncbi:MAG TPA: transcriptional regulator [Amycolatopsis sp.]|uniref:Transcriptional regulator n=1 Tax=Amycolatopsis nalaikhensis TaxID=715472 RepID=A0ABY8XB69_9PSEU|nr:transcriptional regulator [Amycolatopsis sp. 2-2]WIV53246.1 transcriptional regulator [Amycolatopsis sp. 2-2]
MTNPEFDLRQALPERPELLDVEQLEAQTRALRAVDYRSGGGMCRDAVLVRIHRGHELLAAAVAEPVRTRLCSAVADLHNLAAWTSFDSGHVGAAHHHLDLALALAEYGGNDELAANIRYRRGRIYLHHGAPDEALAQFQHGRLAARRCGSDLAASILSANQAWAYAKKGNEQLALDLLGRATEEFEAAAPADPPDWARFFTETDVSAMVGTVHTELALHRRPRRAQVAIAALTDAVARYGPEMARSRSFCQAMLAADHLLEGNLEQGARIGTEAVDAAETLKSVRTKDRLRPLGLEAEKRRDHPAVRALSEHITAFVVSSTHV